MNLPRTQRAGAVSAILTALFAGAAAAVAVQAMLNKRDSGTTDLIEPPENSALHDYRAELPEGSSQHPGVSGTGVPRRSRLRDFCLVLLPPAAVAGVIWTRFPHEGFVVRILVVAGVQLVLAGVVRRNGSFRPNWVTNITRFYLGLFWAGSALAILGRLTSSLDFTFGAYDQTDPVSILATVMLGILVLCIPAIVFAGLAEFQPVIEPILYGAMAILTLILCLPAINNLTGTVGATDNSGSVTLYVAGPSKHYLLSSDLILPGIQEGGFGGKTIMTNWISDDDKKPFRWVLVLRGGARLTDVEGDDRHITSLYAHVNDLGLTGSSGSTELVQLISGASPDGIINFTTGATASTFAADTTSRRTAALPSYQSASRDDGSVLSATKGYILRALGGNPSSAPLGISVNASPFDRQDTIASASPAPTDSGSLSWRGAEYLSPSFTLVDSNRADKAQNVLFVIAVLLGVATSALLMAIQSTISFLGPRRKRQ
jgi:hypothetical protein